MECKLPLFAVCIISYTIINFQRIKYALEMKKKIINREKERNKEGKKRVTHYSTITNNIKFEY